MSRATAKPVKSSGTRGSASTMRPKATTVRGTVTEKRGSATKVTLTPLKPTTLGHSDLTKAVRSYDRKKPAADEKLLSAVDAKIDAQAQLRALVANIDTIEDAFRQTGRTTQMLETAARLARSGTPVLIIMKDEARVDQVLNTAKFYANTMVNVRSHNPKLPLFDWSTLEPIVPEYQGWKVFIDHDVAYAYNRQILNLLLWNQPLTGDVNAN